MHGRQGRGQRNNYILRGSGPARKRKRDKRRASLLVRRAVAICAALAIITGIVNLIALIPKRDANAPRRLWFSPGEPARAFGSDLLFMSDGMISCVGANGGLRWQHPLVGGNFHFYSNAGFVVAWSGQQIFVIDKSGATLVSARITENIQFARVGATYVAVLAGDGDKQYIRITDHLGNEIERIADIGNMTMLDIGFFDNQDTRMWIYGMDINGAEPLTVFSTYDPRGRRSTGNVSIADQLVYNVYWHNRWLMLAGTNTLTAYDYNCTAVADRAPTIVYGWQQIQSRAVRNDTLALFRRTEHGADAGMTRALRLIGASTDTLLRLPVPAVDALLGSRGVYAFTRDKVYVCAYGSTVFTPHELHMPLDYVIATLDDDVAVFASGAEVYMIKLPVPKKQ